MDQEQKAQLLATLRQTEKDQKLRRVIVDKQYMALDTRLQSTDPDQYEIDDLLAVFIENESLLKGVDNLILQFAAKANEDDDDYAARFEEIGTYRNRAIVLINRARRFLSSIKREEVSGSKEDDKKNRKLPKLDLPKFGGELKEWLPFWSQFAEIHKDPRISSSDKFQYLIQSTIPNSEAREVVISFPICEENYMPALDQLKKRFGREKLLVKVYVRDLLRLVIDNAQNKKTSLSSLFVKLSAQIRALESLGVTTDKCASIIFPLVESCIPEETLRAWQRDPMSRDVEDGGDELEAIIKFLEKEVGAEDNIKLACTGLGSEEEKKIGATRINNKTKESKSSVATAAGLLSLPDDEDGKCAFCRKNHLTELCGKASDFSFEKKREILAKGKRCYTCFKKGHGSNQCKSFVKCVICSRRHHTIMCRDLSSRESPPPPQQKKEKKVTEKDEIEDEQEASAAASLANQTQSPEVLLQTVHVRVYGKNGSIVARALFDSGSHKSYVTRSLASKLELPKVGEESVVHCLFGGSTSSEVKHNRYNLMISDVHDTKRYKFDVSDIQKISGKIRQVPPGTWIDELKAMEIQLTDVGNKNLEVDILIGADVSAKLMTGDFIELKSGPVAVGTHLGWTLMGKLPENLKRRGDSTLLVMSMHVTDADVTKLWELDTIGITDPSERKSREELEQSALNHFKKTVKIQGDGRYEVHLPWLEGHPPLPQNLSIAESRLRKSTVKLKENGMFEKYDEVLKSWERAGIIENVTADSSAKNIHYLPHRAVYKPESTTTPVRPVFDASCRAKGQPSLNDCMEKGPNLLELIPDLITRFRMRAVGAVADIRKAFQQISIRDDDRDCLRFLWWDNNDCKKMKVYRHSRVVFGVSSSPFILGATLNHVIQQATPPDDEAAKVLSHSLYVDNVVASFEDMAEAETFKNSVDALLLSAKFELRDWEFGPCQEDKNVPLLGLTWNIKDDTLMCDLRGLKKHLEGPISKRRILSLTHMIFDPVGFTCPFTIVPKQLLQEAWSQKLGWDSELPDDICKKFESWKKQLQLLEELKIPRFFAAVNPDTTKWSLHCFVDASKKAYAAAVYLRVENEEEVTVQLVQAKARVSPLKPMTIPRLELLSCLIGARLVHTVKTAMQLPQLEVKLWTDASTPLFWIRNGANWGVFVQNRIQEIRKLTDVAEWNHVPGDMNPADVPSRGCGVKQLIQMTWWEGPAWLKLEKSEWPQSCPPPDMLEINEEMKKSVVSAINNEDDDEHYMKICELKTYDDMIEYVVRNMSEAGGTNEEISARDIDSGDIKLLQLVQQHHFQNLHDNKRISKMNIVKEDGLLKLQTRLMYGDFADSFKKPILLPSKDPVVHALIRREHENYSHAGVRTMQVKLREKFWILSSRRAVKFVVDRCSQCQRFNSRKFDCVMPPLPKDRMQAEFPFEVTGVDLAGPMFLKDGRKCWFVLFTCAVYRAVHLELVTSLSTDAFKNALRRFISRRGRPKIIYSDNGTNFVGCNNELMKINWKTIEKYGAHQRIVWRFNPPTAAWWGGWWERLVGVVKQCLRRVLGAAVLSFEELQTVLCDAEAVVNNRPLTYVEEDPNEASPITPQMFLIGNRSSSVPEVDSVDGKGLNQRMKFVQRVRDDLRSRFKKEYLGQLASMKKGRATKAIRVGDVVLIGQDNIKRIEWPIGKVVAVFPGKDGEIRVAKVLTRDGEFLRPVQRLYQMESPWEAEVQDTAEHEESQQAEVKAPRSSLVTRSGRRVKIPDRLTYINV